MANHNSQVTGAYPAALDNGAMYDGFLSEGEKSRTSGIGAIAGIQAWARCARAGIAFDRALVYATGGWAFGRGKSSQCDGDQDMGYSNATTRNGWVAGAGSDDDDAYYSGYADDKDKSDGVLARIGMQRFVPDEHGDDAMQSVLKFILGRAVLTPERNAMLLSDRALTYRMLLEGVNSVQAALSNLSLDRTRPVGVLLESPARHVIVSLALAKSGYCSVALRNDLLRDSARVGVKAVLCDKAFFEPGLAPHVVDESWFMQSADHAPMAIARPDDDQVVRVEFTSGSTGTAKPVGFTDDAILSQTLNRISTYALDEAIALCMFRVTSNVGFGFALARLMQGKTICFADSNDNAIDMINYYGVGSLVGSPAQIMALAARMKATRKSVAALRKTVLAGSQISNSDLEELRGRLGGEIIIDYGSTETGPVAISGGDLTLFGDDVFPPLMPLQRVEIVASGELAGAAGGGVVRMRSTGMGWPFSGKLAQGDSERGDGWFYPGDTGRLTNDGRLVISGRTDNLVNLGGVKYPPEAFEAMLRGYPGIVEAAVALGSHADGAGVSLRLAAVANTPVTLGPLNAWLKQKDASVRVEALAIVSDIPKTESGKIDRMKIREILDLQRTKVLHD